MEIRECVLLKKLHSEVVSHAMRHICIWQQIRRHFIYGFSDQCGIFDINSQQNLISSPSSRRQSYNRYSHNHNHNQLNNYNNPKKEDYDEDDVSVCCVCFDGTFKDKNPIIFCDSCNIGVHRYCYGIRKIPNENQEWLCSSCHALKYNHNIKPQCCLCPIVGGLEHILFYFYFISFYF